MKFIKVCVWLALVFFFFIAPLSWWITRTYGWDKSLDYKPVASTNPDKSPERIGQFIFAIACIERFHANTERKEAYAEMLLAESSSLATRIGQDGVNMLAGAAALKAVSALNDDCQVEEERFWNSLPSSYN